ncbi:MAG: hypothetical protein SOX32_01020 [Candidatus Choladocola sp.]|nr:hypothetical protein [Candidatus Choladocola sp.]
MLKKNLQKMFKRVMITCAIAVMSIVSPAMACGNQNFYNAAVHTDCINYIVDVTTGYLALRNAKAYDSRNEIASLCSGTQVTVQDSFDSTYWYVYVPSIRMYGYVNKNYLKPQTYVYQFASDTITMIVSVDSGYLALRNAKAYDARNEIGSLYSGQTVELIDASDSTYWYVYAPSLDKYGYVNCNYLYW